MVRQEVLPDSCSKVLASFSPKVFTKPNLYENATIRL